MPAPASQHRIPDPAEVERIRRQISPGRLSSSKAEQELLEKAVAAYGSNLPFIILHRAANLPNFLVHHAATTIKRPYYVDMPDGMEVDYEDVKVPAWTEEVKCDSLRAKGRAALEEARRRFFVPRARPWARAVAVVLLLTPFLNILTVVGLLIRRDADPDATGASFKEVLGFLSLPYSIALIFIAFAAVAAWRMTSHRMAMIGCMVGALLPPWVPGGLFAGACIIVLQMASVRPGFRDVTGSTS